MTNEEIDCLIIGNNQMVFSEYVKNLKNMGTQAGAFRDLYLSYLEEDGVIYSCSDFYNEYYLNDSEDGPLSYDNILSATITYLGTFLNKHGISFNYLNSFQEGKGQLRYLLEAKRVRTIAITTTYYVSVLPILEIMQFIKQHSEQNIKIIIGGPFVHTQYRIHNESGFKFLLNQIGADFYIISSQGEQSLVNVVNAVKAGQSYETIKNLIYKEGTEYCFNPLAEEDNKLSENLVNWGLFKEYINDNRTRMVMARTANSCPFACTFCSFPEHAGPYRYVAAEEFCKELDQLNDLGSVNSVTFIDDTFNVPLGRYIEILKLFIRKQYRFKWNCNFRCQYADDEVVALMKESGCEGVFLGIESGSDAILKNMNKSASVEAYKKGIALLKKYNILTYASFIIGFPGETEETVGETIDFIETTQPDFFRAQLWYYDTMTPIHKEAEKYGLLNSQFEWSHNTMNSMRAAEWVDYLHYHIKNSVWLPQNDFDFPGIFNLLSRGWRVEQIKEMLRPFNERINAKLRFKQRNEEAGDINQQLLLDTDFDFPDCCVTTSHLA